MDWKRIPSLGGLRAFEATARQRTYSAAARELNVTEAAIRQHLRGLESFFQQALVVRSGRGVMLTEAGTKLAGYVASGFNTLQTGVEELLNDDEIRPLKIALTPAFAENWLMPRLGLFWIENPDIEIELAPSLKVVDLKEGGYDLAIRYGHGVWQGYESELLASAEYVVVAAQEFAARCRESGLEDLKSFPWLFEATRTEHQLWAEERGLDFNSEINRFYPTNSLVLSAVRAGHGLSLQARALVENDLKNGTLVTVYSEDSGTLGYYLVTRSDQRNRLQTFIRWLRANA